MSTFKEMCVHESLYLFDSQMFDDLSRDCSRTSSHAVEQVLALSQCLFLFSECHFNLAKVFDGFTARLPVLSFQGFIGMLQGGQ